MKMLYGVSSCVTFLIVLQLCSAQVPPRLNIPGAVFVQGSRPSSIRQQRINTEFIPRPRRPNPGPSQIREVRPVVEDEEENYPQQISGFDAEVNKLSIPALSSAVRQAAEEEEEPTLRPSPLPFRPERPIPVTRDQIRERPIDFPSPRPSPLPSSRQDSRPLPPITQNRPAQAPRPIRPSVRQELDEDEEENVPVRRQKARPQNNFQTPPQQFRPVPQRAPAPRPAQYNNDDGNRNKKPVSQILRKYRTDNADGSITWGFENDDGTFKEETLGIDCVTKGKYGYVDPEGTKREFSYETGNRCDPQSQELEDEEEELAPRPQPKKPVNYGKPQPQYRPQQVAQY